MFSSQPAQAGFAAQPPDAVEREVRASAASESAGTRFPQAPAAGADDELSGVS